MAAFEFGNAEELGRVFNHHGVKYLFFGKSEAILLGYSDTTQDVDLYVDKHSENCEKVVTALLELGFRLSETEQEEIRRGKDLFNSGTAGSTWILSSHRMVSNDLRMLGSGMLSATVFPSPQKDPESATVVVVQRVA